MYLKYFIVILFVFLFTQIDFAQSSVCSNAPVLPCNGFCTIMPDGGANGPFPLCPGQPNSAPHNTHWYQIELQTSGCFTINVTPENCQDGNGIQGGIYDNCNFLNAFDCNGSCNTSAFSLTVCQNAGEVSYLVIDGCNTDICDYSLSWNPNGPQPVVDPVTNVEIPVITSTNLVPPFQISSSGFIEIPEFSIESLTGICDINWTITPAIPNDIIIGDNERIVQVDATGTESGLYLLCAIAQNGCSVSTPGCVPIQISENVPPLDAVLSISGNPSFIEGNSGNTLFEFGLTRIGNRTNAVSVDFKVSGTGNNPADGSDFTNGLFPTGTIDFAVNELSKTIEVEVSGDNQIEFDEEFKIKLSNPLNAILDTIDAFGIILNDDFSSISLCAEGWREVKKLKASDRDSRDIYGRASISNDIVIVGAPWEDTGGTNIGAAYIYKQNEGGTDNWGEVVKIQASDGVADLNFGGATAIDGEFAIVGARGPSNINNGTSAYIFSRNEGGTDNWGEVQKIQASDATTNDGFGWLVDISGDIAIVSSIFGINAVYIYQHNPIIGTWSEQKKLISSNPDFEFSYGWSASVSDDCIIVGDPVDSKNGIRSGAAYIYERNEGGIDNWGEVIRLEPSDGKAEDQFGWSAVVSGDIAVIGAIQAGSVGVASGAVYIYYRDQGGANNWGEVTKLSSNDAQFGDGFGKSVSLSGDYLIVGAPDEDSKGDIAGAVYLFERNAGGMDNWGQILKLNASDAQSRDIFGTYVSIDKENVVVGAVWEADLAGATYIFSANCINDSNSTDPGCTDCNIINIEKPLALEEGNTGVTTYEFEVIRTGDFSIPISVDYSLSGTGDFPVQPTDFAVDSFPSGTIFFAPNEISKTVKILVRGDVEFELDEEFIISLSNQNPTDAVINLGEVTGVILNDDPDPCIQVFSTDVPKAIPGFSAVTNTVISTLEIDAPGTVNDLNVYIDAQQDRLGNLTISLISPQGTEVRLLTEKCGFSSNLDVTFDDENFRPIDCPLRFITIEPESPLSAFDGEDVKGIWQLKVIDGTSTVNFNEIEAWRLDICRNLPPIIPPIPTLGEWCLILLTLLLLTTGTLVMIEPSLSVAGVQSFSFRNLPFDRVQYFKSWLQVVLGVGLLFIIAILGLGYEVTSADPFGAILCSFVTAYWLYILRPSEG